MVDNGWPTWEKKVLSDLERLDKGQEAILEALGSVRTEVAALQVRASVWGFLSGALGSAIAGLLYVVLKR